MESAYLKSCLGPVLAKAVAETVLAQPSNPQEYLGLFLLHVLQEEQRAAASAALRKKLVERRQIWAADRALREKRAADTIQSFFRRFRVRLSERRAAEAALLERYEDAEADADALMDAGPFGEGGPGEGPGDGEELNEEISEAAATYTEARAAFFRAQRFVLQLRKADVGALKVMLLARREEVRAAQDRQRDALDRAEEEIRVRDEAVFAAAALVGTLPGPGAAAADDTANASNATKTTITTTTTTTTAGQKQWSETVTGLTRQMAAPRHERISFPLLLYRVLRCWCYALLDSTPKQTDTPAKVAALVKPFIFVHLLRAYNPVATYQRGHPLRLEDMVQGDDEGKANADASGAEAESEPTPQTKPRQVRRLIRVMRTINHDGEYLCAVNPLDYLGDYASDEAAQDEEGKDTDKGAAEEFAAIAAAEAAAARGEEIAARVEDTARNHSVLLYGLLRLLRTAVQYREARDRWVALLQQSGQDAPAGEEMPEDDEEDLHNDEGPRDEEGELDEMAARRVQTIIGIDADEMLAKVWAQRDEEERQKWRAIAAARKSAEAAANEEDEEDEGDA